MFVISVRSCKNNEPNFFFESTEALTFFVFFCLHYLIIFMCIGIINLSLNYAKFYPKTMAKTIWFLMPFVFIWSSEQTARHSNQIATDATRVSVQGVKSLGGHLACLCRGFEFYEVKKNFLLLFFKTKMEILLHFQSFL